MKTLLLTPVFPPEKGGAAFDFGYLSQILTLKPEVSEILVISNWRGARKLFRETGKVKQLKLLKYGKSNDPLTILKWNALVIRESIKRFKPNTIIFHSVILPYRDYYPELFQGIRNIKIYLYKTDLFPVPDFPELTGVVYMAGNIGKMLRNQGIPEEKLHYIPILFRPPQTSLQVQIPGIKYILFVGSTDPLKGFYQLVKAYYNLRKEHVGLKLLVIGRDIQGSAFDPDIVFLEELNHRQVAAYIKGAEAVVIPSYSEGLPRVALETIYLCKPLIITSIVEETRSLGRGQVLESNEPGEIAHKVSAILNGAPFNPRFPWEDFAFKKSAALWNELLENIEWQPDEEKFYCEAFVDELLHRFERRDRSHVVNQDAIFQLHIIKKLDSSNWETILESVKTHSLLMNHEKKSLLEQLLTSLASDFSIFLEVKELTGLFQSLPPLTANNFLFLGNYCLKSNKPEAAKQFFEKGLHEGPESIHISIIDRMLEHPAIELSANQRAELLQRLPALEKSVLTFLTNKTAKTLREFYLQGSLLKRLKRFAQSERAFMRIIRFPDNDGVIAGANFHLGEIALSQKEYRKAFNCFKRTLDLLPEHKKAAVYHHTLTLITAFPQKMTYKELYDFASQSKRKGDPEKAKIIWDFLVQQEDKIHPHYIGAASFKLGDIALEAGDQHNASGYFKQCLRFIPNHIKALYYSGKLENIQRDWSQFKKEIANIMTDKSIFSFLPKTPKNSFPDSQVLANDRIDYPYLVTAVISTYNSELHIRGCLEDLEAQTIADRVEIIVVNSGSTQNEEAVVREFQEKYDNIVYLKTKQRETIYKAWNRAVKIARGKYITNANTDDRHRKDAFDILTRYLDNHPETGVVYAKQFIVDTPGLTFDTASPIGKFDWPEFERENLMEFCGIGPQPMWRTSIHQELGCFFDESLEVSGDYDFWLRVSQYTDFHLIDQYLGIYFKDPDQSNKEWQNRYLTLKEQYTVQRKYYRSMLGKFSSSQFQHRIEDTVQQLDKTIKGLQELGAEEKRRFIFLSWALAVQFEFLGQLTLSKEIAAWALRLMGDGNRLARHLMDLNLTPTSRKVEGNIPVSVVIPFFNNENTITETLTSISNQTYKNLETIIVDSGSSAASLARLQQILKSFPELEVRLISEGKKNNKPRRNIAVKKARGDYIVPLDADDLLAAAYVEKSLKEFENTDALDVVYSETIVFGFINELWVTRDFSYSGIFNRNQLSVTAMIKKESLLEAGGYRENLPGYEDWDLWIRFAKMGKTFKRIPEPLFFYRKTTSSRGYLSRHKDLKKRLALIWYNSDVYRMPLPSEMALLEQNPQYIPKIFLKET